MEIVLIRSCNEKVENIINMEEGEGNVRASRYLAVCVSHIPDNTIQS